MKQHSLVLLFSICIFTARAAKLSGTVKDSKGESLAFASVYIKGTTKGTTTNLDGKYVLEVTSGNYTFVCQYVGYQKQEFEVKIDQENVTKNFTLSSIGHELKQVVIKKGEDPAYRIIREAIKKRSFYNKQIDQYKANAYIKGSVKLDDVGKLGLIDLLTVKTKDDSTTVKSDDSATLPKGILALAESFCEISYKRPNKLKVVVKSSRMSGNKQSYGFSDPIFINMYDNNINISEQLTPRGLISPIAETAMLNYKYELLDTYQEDGKTISVIKVIPRRKFEPLFSGVIHIIEDEWRIHSLNLTADKYHQLEVMDSLIIKQVFVPVNNVLMVKDQSFKMKMNFFGISISGNFVNVFTDYVFDYNTKNTFDKFEKEFDKDALLKTKEYWNATRPVPLDTEEVRDFIVKDSLEIIAKAKKDTVVNEKNGVRKILLKGYSKNYQHGQSLHTSAIVDQNSFNWNTAEGLNYSYSMRYNKKINIDKRFDIGLKMRYGFSNQQFNAKASTHYFFGKTNKTQLEFSTGRYVFQYSNEEPVNPLINSLYTLFYGRNYLKEYQAYFANARIKHQFINGITLQGQISYQDRSPLANTNLYSFKKNDVQFTQNYPIEKLTGFEPQHQALLFMAKASYQPGRKYTKYPDRIVASSSNYPTFHVEYTKGLPMLGSDVDYDKWNVSMEDNMRLRVWGNFSYNIAVGGFLSNTKSYLADYKHFNGNQIILASPYLNSFQLSSYYANSNTQSLYTTLHAEHHFNGLLTNKIPLFRNLKWYLVASTNSYYVTKNNNYVEASVGLENIGYKMFRFLRVDGIAGYSNFKHPVYGIRVGIASSFLKIGARDDD